MNVYEVKYENDSRDDYVVAKNCVDVAKIVESHNSCLILKSIRLIASDVLMKKVDTTYEDAIKANYARNQMIKGEAL